MTPPLQAFLDRFLPDLFRARPSDIDSWFFEYFSDLVDPAARRRYARAVCADLDLAGIDPEGSVLLDAGSGFGITLLCFAAMKPRLALGLEAFRPMALSSTRLVRRAAERVGPLPALVVRGSVVAFPVAARTVDFIYCNEALSHFLDRDTFYDECARVLKPGGRLMICDGNNAANGSTVRKVRQIWKHFEEGPPVDDLFGHRVERPYRDRRREMIAAALPGLTSDTLDRLAWGTFGRHGTDIVATARQLLDSGKLPSSPPPVDRSPVDPLKGDHIESLVDPVEVGEQLVRRGFRVTKYAHFGGARGALLAGMNRLLRAATPLTIRWARSVKIVAVRTG